MGNVGGAVGAAPSPPAAARPLLASSRDSSIPRASALLFFALLIFFKPFFPSNPGEKGEKPRHPQPGGRSLSFPARTLPRLQAQGCAPWSESEK